jgi:hypothetical protein
MPHLSVVLGTKQVRGGGGGGQCSKWQIIKVAEACGGGYDTERTELRSPS